MPSQDTAAMPPRTHVGVRLTAAVAPGGADESESRETRDPRTRRRRRAPCLFYGGYVDKANTDGTVGVFLYGGERYARILSSRVYRISDRCRCKDVCDHLQPGELRNWVEFCSFSKAEAAAKDADEGTDIGKGSGRDNVRDLTMSGRKRARTRDEVLAEKEADDDEDEGEGEDESRGGRSSKRRKVDSSGGGSDDGGGGDDDDSDGSSNGSSE